MLWTFYTFQVVQGRILMGDLINDGKIAPCFATTPPTFSGFSSPSQGL